MIITVIQLLAALICAFTCGHAFANRSYSHCVLFVSIAIPQLAFVLMELAA